MLIPTYYGWKYTKIRKMQRFETCDSHFKCKKVTVYQSDFEDKNAVVLESES